MAKLGIGTGIVPDDGTGDSLLDGAVKINSNFDDIYTYFGDGTNLTFTDGVSSQWVTTGVGIHTISNVGIGTTNPRFILEVGAVGASGTSLYVNGDARVTGIVTIGPASITLNGISNIINVGSGVTINGSTGTINATSINLGGTTLTGSAVTSITAGSGISVDQSTGNVTISATGGGSGGESYWVETSAGIHTLSNVGIGTTNPTSTLTVGGDVLVSDKIVAGLTSSIIPFYWENFADLPSFSTYHGAFAHVHQTGKAYYAHTRWVELVNKEANGTVGTGTENFNVGVVTATTFSGSGSGLTNIPSNQLSGALPALDGSALIGLVGVGTGVEIQENGSPVGTAVTINFGTNLDVSFSGGIATVDATGSGGSSQFVTTAAGIHTLSNVGIGTTNPTSALTVVGDASISGVATATTFVGSLTGTATSTTNIPNLIGDITSTGTTTAITAGVIINADINASAGIVDTKLDTISTAGKVSNSATTATSANTNSAIVARDGSGNFTAGTITATTFSGSGSGLTGLPDFTIIFTISATGSDDYIFSGPGIVAGNTNDPILYLYKGFTYTFINTTGGSHPFAIRESNGGASYTPGVSGSTTGTQTFIVPMNAPSTLYYQCTIHSGMGNVINIV